MTKKGEASIKLQFNDADLAAKFANQLVEMTIGIYRTNLSLSFDSVKNQKIEILNNVKKKLNR